MGLVNLKEMAKQAKKTEEEIMDLVEIGIIKPQRSYCHPGDFGDGRQIAFYPENALADIKEGKSKPKPEPEPEEDEMVAETEPEEPEAEEPEEEEATGEPTPEKAEPEPEPKKEEPKGKGKKTGKK